MEQTQETGQDIFQFDPVNNPDHLHLLGLVTLDKTKLVDPEWLLAMREHIAIGSRIKTQNGTLSEGQAIDDGRCFFENETGIVDPEHELSYGYTQQGRKPRPLALLRTVQGLEKITGNGPAALVAAPKLMFYNPDKLGLRYRYMERLASYLGWQGDMREFLQSQPRILERQSESIRILAHLAARHGSVRDQKLTLKDLTRINNATPEAHLMAAVSDIAYVFGTIVTKRNVTAWGLPAMRRYIHETIASGDGVACLGEAVVRRYFAYKPPSTELITAHPHLKQYMRPEKFQEKKEETIEITGTELWLTDGTRVPAYRSRRAERLRQLREAVRDGDVILQRNHNDAVHDKVIDARFKAFDLLGLADARSDTYNNFISFVSSYPTLVRPSKVIALCNLMERRGIDKPLSVIRSCMSIVVFGVEKIDERITHLEEMGLDINHVLTTSPQVLKYASPEAAGYFHLDKIPDAKTA
jgi:hypothetical protein